MQMHHKLKEDYLHVTVTGNIDSTDVANLPLEFRKVSELCDKHECKRVFFDAKSNVEELGTFDLFYSGTSIANMPNIYELKIAVFVRPEQIRGNFFETVAVNRGANLRVFTDQQEAFSWLLQEK